MLKDVASCTSITYLGRGEQIEFGDDNTEKYLYIIRTGSMEQRRPDGVLRSKMGEEDLFGFTFLEPLKNALDGYKATAIENTLLYKVPHSKLLKLTKQYPQFSESISAGAQLRLRSALNVVWSNKEKGLFLKKVSEVARGQAAVVDIDMSIQDVAKEMRNACRSSTAIIKQDGKIVGLITDRDMTKRVIADGMDISLPIKAVMTTPAITIDPDDLILKAASLMMQYNIRSLPVVRGNDVLGLLTSSHLVQKHRMQAIFLIEKIKYTDTPEGLAELTSERQAIFEALVEGRVDSEIIGQVMAMIMDGYNRRLLQMAEEQFGAPPCDYNWIVAGSHARNEVHMLSDQDSAIILQEGATEADKAYFQQLSEFVTHHMDACGYPNCTGHYMASNPKWCQTLSVWKECYRKWVTNPQYGMLMNVSVFLEVRSLHGNAELSESLQNHLHSLINEDNQFLPSLVNDAVRTQPPLGIFNKLVLEKSGNNTRVLNIKKYALTLIVDLARIYGLAVGCSKTGTRERFEFAVEQKLLNEDDFKDVIEAFYFLTQLRFNHQLSALRQGLQPNNHMEPSAISSFERKHLKDAFRIISNMQEAAKLRFSSK
ncbi:putative nucleotidyltransferase substrate binding domain-containing protein [Shewanella maritima]|uniref:putative nucleotidyltransferase substrate binding domain-containing protein n=1 Tax=Shewanella maritima TaxID=2520507 RepID=UPI001A9141D6|nr:putative nucleotidyltransferase substrate binding domain-containing protein [Shewanella maritima]